MQDYFLIIAFCEFLQPKKSIFIKFMWIDSNTFSYMIRNDLFKFSAALLIDDS